MNRLPSLSRAGRRMPRRRAGLAVLELVLSLPILLMMMALIIGAGAVAAWRIRTETAARNESWRHNWPRGDYFASVKPKEWPLPVAYRTGQNVAALDGDVYKATLVHGGFPNLPVKDNNLFDPTRGLVESEAKFQRRLPLMKRLPAYSFDVENILLDDAWNYREMGMGANFYHRLRILYDLSEPQQGLQQTFKNAAATVASIHRSSAMSPMDRDDEFMSAMKHYPNFYPHLRSFVSLDVDMVRERYVQPFTERIPGKNEGNRRITGVPDRLASGFIGLYRFMQRQLANQMKVPDISQQQIDTLQQGIDALQQKIDTLNRFLQQLRRPQN